MLNDDINLCVLYLLDDQSLESICRSNHYFNNLCKNNYLWYYKIKLIYFDFDININADYKYVYYKLKQHDYKSLLKYTSNQNFIKWVYKQKYIYKFDFVLDQFMESLNFYTSD